LKGIFVAGEGRGVECKTTTWQLHEIHVAFGLMTITNEPLELKMAHNPITQLGLNGV
jgi:hypothetical protein